MKIMKALTEKVKSHFKEHASTYLLALIAPIFYSPLIIAGYYQQKIQDLGGGFQMLKCFDQTRYSFQHRTLIDFKSDGTLDQTCKSMPVGPFMGGPGYMLVSVPTTDEDRTNFEKAKRLESLVKK